LAESKAYLESLNRDLESTNQDLQSANEEVLSANEELQSTNEELETAKEELQSANEELTTVNDELQNRNIELDQLSNDLINILGSIEIPILMVGKDGKIRRVTPAAQKALNLQNSDVGRPIREVKSYFDVLGLELDLEQKVAEVVETMTATETEIQDGKSRWFRLQVRPYRTLDNRIDGVVVALIDIDALKRSLAEVGLARSEAEKARQSAEAGNRTKDLFLATLSHELRTPLTTILTYSQLLRLGKLSSEDIKKSMLMIEQSAQAQAQLINDLLDVSRIMMGKLALELQKINPATVLHDTIESLRPLAERKSIQIVEKISDQNLFICGDLTRLKQIFLNLLTNAVKFSKNDDVIEIYLDYLNEGERDIVCIRVKDFGKGVSEKFLPFLFDRFSQADSSSTRNHGGMGLGLAIVRSLAEAHGGSVHAESPGEGKGATFTVKLPLSSRESSAQIIEAHSNFPTSLNSLGKMTKHQEIPRLDGLRILFVDDDPSARESLGTLLKSLGAIVILVESVRAAIEELPLFRPDILISDLAIPDENGYSLIKKVRRFLNEEFRSLPALALTAFAGVEDAKRAIDAGFDAHLAKPVDSYEFAKAILNVIQSE
jgi:two-component system CheB/CheR fusion protein